MSDTPNAQSATLPYSDAAFSRGVVVRTAENHQMMYGVPAEPEGLPEGAVLATARDPKTKFATNAPTPDSLVKIGGVEMPIRAAVAQGFVRQNPDGTFSDVDPQERAAEIRAAQEAEAARVQANQLPIDPQAADDVNAVFRGLGELGIDPMETFAEMLGKPRLPNGDAPLPRGLIKLAAVWDVPVEEMKERMSGAMYALAGAIDVTLLIPAGVEPDAFRKWVKTSVSRTDHNRAILHALGKGDLVGYRHLLARYMRSPAYLNDAKVPEGAVSYKTHNGRTVVRAPGLPDMSVATAHRFRIN